MTDFRKTMATVMDPRLSSALALEGREDNQVSQQFWLRLQVKPTPIDWINKSILFEIWIPR